MTVSDQTPGSSAGPCKGRLVLVPIICLLVSGLVLAVVLRPTGNAIPPPYESFGLPLIAVERIQFCPNETVGGICFASGSSVEVSDLDSDGQVEIVAHGAAPLGETVTVWHYSSGVLSLIGSASNESYDARALCVADLGGDSRKEIVTGGWGRGYNRRAAYLALWEWDGTNLTRLTNVSWTWNNEDTDLQTVVCADLDGDGRVDIAATGWSEPTSGPRVGWISVWNATADLKSLQREAETSLWSSRGDVMPRAAVGLGTTLFVSGTATDWANGTVGGLLGLFAFNGTSVQTLDTQVVPNADYRVASTAEPTGPGAFRLLVGGYDGSQKTILETVSVDGSAVGSVGPRSDYRVPTHTGNYTGFTGLAVDGDLAVASGWVDQEGNGYAFVQGFNGTSGLWRPGLLSEWRYLVQVNAADSWVNDVVIADVETGGPREVVTVGQAWGQLELRVWRLSA